MTPEEMVEKIVSGIEESATVDEVRRIIARAIAEELEWAAGKYIHGWIQREWLDDRAAAYAALAEEGRKEQP
jgi:hypothetical protein